MNDDWELPVPKEDPEARKAEPGQGGSGCPRLVPDGNFVEGEMVEEGRQDSPSDPSP